MFALGLATDFIAVINERCFEIRLYSYSWVTGIEAYIMIPQQQLSEQLTYTLRSHFPHYRIARTAWSEERGELWFGFSVGADALKNLITERESTLDAHDATPEFLPALNDALKETGCKVIAQSALKAAS